jgi:endonuclease/exonuclease/phosphatase family metal-dependent hydrolase
VRHSTLRVGTWNILGRQRYEGSDTADGAVRGTLTEVPVDVLCLQEVHFYDGLPDAQLRKELHGAGLTYFAGEPLSPSHLDENAQLGVGIAARVPLDEVQVRTLSNPGLRANVRGQEWELHDKGLVGARVRLDEDTFVNVYSLHLFPFFEFGVNDRNGHVDKMWRELWDYVDGNTGSTRVILAGDYNQAKRVEAAKEWSQSNWNFCATDTITTTVGLPLDDVALNWSTSHCRPEVFPTFSDHHLVVVELAF